MKYRRNRAYAREFGVLLADAVGYLPAQTIVTHLPTASKRIRQRGFDQAALIAESFAKQLQLSYAPLLYRTTQVDQIGKNRRERLAQMQSSFALHGSKTAVVGSTITLIDDVITTGASIEAAATMLRKNGAIHVDAAVVARHFLK